MEKMFSQFLGGGLIELTNGREVCVFESFVRFDLLARFAFCSHPSETVLKTRLTN